MAKPHRYVTVERATRRDRFSSMKQSWMTSGRTLFAALLLLALGADPGFADQDDPELDTLFVELQDPSLDLGAAQQLEGLIWQHWFRHDDEEVAAVMNEGGDHLRYGDLEAALQMFDEAVELAPDFAEAWNRRATVNYHLGRYEASLADIEETLAREPRHFGALFGRGLVFMGLEEWEKAYNAFGETLEVNPHAVNALTLRKAIEAEHLGDPT